MFDLNPEQRECVEHEEGALQIIAGAGSGKTRVLTERVVSLIERGVDPENILAMAFNKKAQTEMLERVTARVGEEVANKVWIRTFHSFGYQIVNENSSMFGYRGRVGVLSGGRLQFFVEKALQDAGMSPEEHLGKFFAALRFAKLNDMDASEYIEASRSSKELSATIGYAYASYERQKREANVVDFDDMIFLARRALIRNPQTRDKWQKQFSYVLIDEFQDVDDAQFDIIKTLALPENNLTVVGDDDQSIYSFRGANPSFTTEFQNHYPDAKVTFLIRNYRSSKNIIDVSNRLIHINENRVEKELVSETDFHDLPCGEIFGSAETEAVWVAENVRGFVDSGGDAGEFACIYRTNAQAAFLETALMRLGLPYVVMGGFSFYDRKEVLDLVAYLSLAENGDNESFERIFNRPNRFLGKAFIEEMRSIGGNHLENCRNIDRYRNRFRGAYVAKNVKALVSIIDSIQRNIAKGLPVDELLTTTAKLIHYKEFLSKSVEGDEEDIDVMSNVNTLVEVAEKFHDVNRFIEFITGMREANAKAAEGDTTGLVKLMTIHKSKGLEFPRVFVVGLSEDILPHKMAQDVEEERRLAYVAMTRAESFLRVSSIRSYNGNDKKPSRFLMESGISVAGLDVEDVSEEEVIGVL